MKRVYLDSNILIAYYSQDKTEESKRKMVQEALAVFTQLKDTQLCTSMWSITEMVNILVSGKKMDRGTVAEIESQLVSEKRMSARGPATPQRSIPNERECLSFDEPGDGEG